MAKGVSFALHDCAIFIFPFFETLFQQYEAGEIRYLSIYIKPQIHEQNVNKKIVVVKKMKFFRKAVSRPPHVFLKIRKEKLGIPFQKRKNKII